MGNSTSRREFTRSVDLPSDIQVNLMRSVFSRDGVLSITAPIKPPHYDSVSGHNSSYRGFVFSNIIADRCVCQHIIHVFASISEEWTAWGLMSSHPVTHCRL